MKIHSIIYTSIALAAGVFATGCTDVDEPAVAELSAVTFEITDAGFGSSSRASESGYVTEFTAGDACGLYIVRNGRLVAENVKLTATATDDGSIVWQPVSKIYGGLSDESYYLYYPYQDNISGNVDISATDDIAFFARLISGWEVKADQSDYASYTASDLMTAQGTASKDGNQLVLSFAMFHRMALAVIEMPTTLYKFTDTDIPDCTTATAADYTDSDTKPYRMADGTYRLIVNLMSGTAARITGCYDEGKKEFAITPNGINAGCRKTYKVDGLTPIEKQATLQAGDYFCKDSDNKWYIIPGEANPDSNVIGIVFYSGQYPADDADYSASGIKQRKCHGYVIALTDVHDGDFDCLRWEYGPNKEIDQVVGTSGSTSHPWGGYSNSLKFHEFVNNEKNKEAGWEMKHFPAAFACETYGKRTMDQDGNPANGKYDWQKPLAAPQNTSGWFLPSCGEMEYIARYNQLFTARMKAVKNSTPPDCIYKDKIDWYNMGAEDYWTSTEGSDLSLRRYAVCVRLGHESNQIRLYHFYVRAILAF